MIFSTSEIKFIFDTFDTVDKLKENLVAFCRPIAIALGYQDIDKLFVNTEGVGWISFLAEWNGPYQSHDSKCFSFPAHMLSQGQNDVIDYLKDIEKNENKKEDDLIAQKKLEADLVNYQRLKAIFENKEES